MPHPPTQDDGLSWGPLPAARPHGHVCLTAPTAGTGLSASMGDTLGGRCHTGAGYTSERWAMGGCGAHVLCIFKKVQVCVGCVSTGVQAYR